MQKYEKRADTIFRPALLLDTLTFIDNYKPTPVRGRSALNWTNLFSFGLMLAPWSTVTFHFSLVLALRGDVNTRLRLELAP